MRAVFFVLGSLFGAVCHSETMRFFHTCMDCSVAAFHTIVGLI